MTNPFTIGVVAEEETFCNRIAEKKDLLNHARNGNNVVLCSPRRFGKSSLVQVVLSELKKEEFLTAYVDLFPISSEHDLIERFAASIFKKIDKGLDQKTFFEKIRGIFSRIVPTIEVGQEGYSISVKFDKSEKTNILLDDLMDGLYRHVVKSGKGACIVFDEFQEITELKESKKIEGILRSHIQMHKNISYFFVGSRRRVLKDMFTNRARPFYKSAFFYTLKEISSDDFSSYITELFNKTEKECSIELTKDIYNRVRGYPYYVQKLSSIVWNETDNKCTKEIIEKAFKMLLAGEAIDFEGAWSGLTLAQKSILKMLATEPSASIFSKTTLEKSRTSAGGSQKAIKVLIEKDIVEKTDEGFYRLTDPIMEAWLKQ